MVSFVNRIAKSVTAFNNSEYAEVVRVINAAFALLQRDSLEKMDADIFNALYDVVEMSELILGLPIFKKNSHISETLSDIKHALDKFTSEGGSAFYLSKSLGPFLIILKGMEASFQFVSRINSDPHNNSGFSLEICSGGILKLYTETNHLYSEGRNIELLKSDFELMFDKEEISKEELFKKSDLLEASERFEENINLLREALLGRREIEMDCFLRIGRSFFMLKKYEEAVDAYLKARVLGAPKYKMAEEIKKSCKMLIRNANTRDERNKWSRLSEEF